MLALGFIANVYAQQPEWIRQKPPKSETYYYRIAQATADTEEKAYTKALIKTVCESAISTDFPVDMQQLMMMQEDSALIMLAREVNIPVNVVCQYSEKLVSTTGYKVYLLSQVSNKAGKHPKYNDFNCFTNKEED
jgi:hypothetical protein